MAQHRFLEPQLGSRIGKLGSRDLDFTRGDGDVGLGHGLVPKRLLGGLPRHHALPGKRLLACICVLLLRQNGSRLSQIGVCFIHRSFSDKQGSLGLLHLGLLLALRQACKKLALFDAITLVGIQLHQGRADLEADIGTDPSLNSAKSEDADLDIVFLRHNLHGDRTIVIKGIPTKGGQDSYGRDQRVQNYTPAEEVCHLQGLISLHAQA